MREPQQSFLIPIIFFYRMLNAYLVIVSALVTAQVAAFPGGAPRSACASMAPIHMLFGAQQDTVPFTLSISSAQANSVSPITGKTI